MSLVAVAVLGMVSVQLVIGFWVSRRIATEDDYLLAGRQLGMLMASFTVFATWFGAETCVGAAGQAYAVGLRGNSADPFGYAIALVVMGALLAVPLWRRKLTTLADLFRQRYSPAVERLGVLLMVPTSVMWAAAQIRAFGQVLGALSDYSLDVTITFAAGVVILYTAVGGLLADAYTDLIQGIILIAGLLVVGVMLFTSGEVQALAHVPAERLALVDVEASWLATMERWAVPILGSVVAQELVTRVLAARNPRIARRAPIIAGCMYLALGLIPVTVGVVASQLHPGLEESEQVLIIAAQRYLPTVLYVLFAAALVSAILSTVDSALLVAGSLVAHNLIIPLAGERDDRWRVRVNRVAVVAFGVVAYWLALHAKGVYALVEEASAFGTAGILICTLFGLFSRIGGAHSAVASMVSGLVVYIAGSHFGLAEQPFLTSVAAALAAYLIAIPIGRRAEAA